jgi:hypothetical protein
MPTIFCSTQRKKTSAKKVLLLIRNHLQLLGHLCGVVYDRRRRQEKESYLIFYSVGMLRWCIVFALLAAWVLVIVQINIRPHSDSGGPPHGRATYQKNILAPPHDMAQSKGFVHQHQLPIA